MNKLIQKINEMSTSPEGLSGRLDEPPSILEESLDPEGLPIFIPPLTSYMPDEDASPEQLQMSAQARHFRSSVIDQSARTEVKRVKELMDVTIATSDEKFRGQIKRYMYNDLNLILDLAEHGSLDPQLKTIPAHELTQRLHPQNGPIRFNNSEIELLEKIAKNI